VRGCCNAGIGLLGIRQGEAMLALWKFRHRARRSLARRSRNPGQTKLRACETCRARCRRCQVSQVLLALCLSAVSYYDDAVGEVEPAVRPDNIARSGFK
jgi:hypothetical protein